jgi:hypothetical protein
MAASSSSHLQLLDLPNELISHVFRCLDSPSPFLQASLHQPNPAAVRVSRSPLKQASLLSHRLRRLALPFLFHHVSVDPSHLKSFLSFVKTNDLGAHVASVVAYLPSPCSHYHPPWWFQLLSQLPGLTCISIIAPPHIFSEVTETNTRSRDTWAFNMPLQILQLRYHPSDVDSTEESSRQSGVMGDHLLLARPWSSILVNEGSSLKAYTTWEYWLRSTPSPIYALSDPYRFTAFISNLRSFSLVSIFPIYGHVERALHLIKQMHHLRSLFVKLIPEPESTILSDEIEEAKGHLDVNDPWTEFDTSLALTAAACLYLSDEKAENNDWDMPRLGELEELRVDDVKMTGVRDSIESIVGSGLQERLDLGWTYEGDGCWRRSTKKKTDFT